MHAILCEVCEMNDDKGNACFFSPAKGRPSERNEALASSCINASDSDGHVGRPQNSYQEKND
jgi:hypothetical protein